VLIQVEVPDAFVDEVPEAVVERVVELVGRCAARMGRAGAARSR
jgi:hypothetical protein